MNRKADANMWWIIIGAVIALIVLIVLLVIFTREGNNLQQGISSCKGTCTAPEDACPSSTESSSAFSCNTGGQCCIGFPKKCDSGAAGDAYCKKTVGDKAICHSFGDKKSYCYEP